MCIPYAGAGASLLRQWKRHSFRRIEVEPVQHPGREELFAEEPRTSMAEVVELCVERMRKLGQDAPFALFGLRTQLRRARRPRDRTPPGRRRATVARAPDRERRGRALLPRPVTGSGSLADDAFVARAREVVGYDHPAFHDAELRGLVLPSLRADLSISDRYAPSSTDLLPVPFTVLRGADDQLVSRPDAELWVKATSRPTELNRAARRPYVLLPGPEATAHRGRRALRPARRLSGAEPPQGTRAPPDVTRCVRVIAGT
nr:thioesterase domain-containing protein [Streptomyces antioxidans]